MQRKPYPGATLVQHRSVVQGLEDIVQRVINVENNAIRDEWASCPRDRECPASREEL
jgi:hypothetical protein